MTLRAAGGQDGGAVLLDLENLLHDVRQIGPAHASRALVRVVAQLRTVAPLRHLVACCDRWLARDVYPAARRCGVRVFPGPIGPDRADLELARRAEELPSWLDFVVIASGDGLFASVARAQHAAGRRVIVAARPGTLAAVLRAQADEVIDLTVGPVTPAPLPVAA